jgi:phosphatidylglycerophosphate synthase
MAIPSQILVSLLIGLLSLAVIGAAGYFAYDGTTTLSCMTSLFGVITGAVDGSCARTWA